MRASIEARSGGCTGPSPESDSGPFSRSPVGPAAACGEIDPPLGVERDPERLELAGRGGRAVEQLLRGEARREVLASASAAARRQGQRREHGEQGGECGARRRSGHRSGIAWPPMRGRSAGT